MGITERREREKEMRRLNILNAAEKVFFTKGFNYATMDDVAEAAELSKGTLYLYFKNKEDLYFGLAFRAITHLKKRFSKATEKAEDGLSKVKALGKEYYKYSEECPDYFRTIAQYEFAHLKDEPSIDYLAEKCHMAGQEVLQLVANAVQCGMEDGSIRKDLQPIKTAFLLQGLSTGLIQMMAREKKHIQKLEAFEPEELIDNFIDMMTHALESD